MLLLIALSVVMLIRIVGLILVIALLTIPASITGQFTFSLKKMMISGCLLGAAFIFAGLWLSYRLKLTSGATIVMVACGGYLLTAGGRAIHERIRKSRLHRVAQ